MKRLEDLHHEMKLMEFGKSIYGPKSPKDDEEDDDDDFDLPDTPDDIDDPGGYEEDLDWMNEQAERELLEHEQA